MCPYVRTTLAGDGPLIGHTDKYINIYIFCSINFHFTWHFCASYILKIQQILIDATVQDITFKFLILLLQMSVQYYLHLNFSTFIWIDHFMTSSFEIEIVQFETPNRIESAYIFFKT